MRRTLGDYVCKLFGGRLDKFVVGQLLFITAVTFGLFLSDTARKILLICALFCIDKHHLKNSMWDSWTKEQRIISLIIGILGFWLLFIPLLFGVEPFKERVRSLGWLIELILWMLATLWFARDSRFLNNIKKFAIGACFCYSLLALCQRYGMGFVVNFDNWPLRIGAWSVGTILSVLLPWVLCELIFSKSTCSKVLLFVTVIMTGATMILTMYTTFWLVLAVEIFTLLSLILFFYRQYFLKICACIICALSIIVIGLYSASSSYNDMYNRLLIEFQQLSLKELDAERFTNERYHIWIEAYNFIKERPVVGYGWADFAKFSIEQRGHTHCSFLQAAWTGGIPSVLMYSILMLSFIYSSVLAMKNKKVILTVPLIVILVLSAYITCGVLDDMFRATRRIVTLYWVTFMLTLTPLFYYDNVREK